MLQKFNLRTNGKENMHNITAQVCSAVQESGVQDGIAVIFSPHTTGRNNH